jgi:hypothetical protein
MKLDTIYIESGSKLTVLAHIGFDQHGNAPSKNAADAAAAQLKVAFPEATIVVLTQPVETLQVIVEPKNATAQFLGEAK